MVAIGSQAFRLTFNRSPLDMHIVPSLPPTQYSISSSVATAQLLRLLLMAGTNIHLLILGSYLSTVDW